MRLGKFIAQQLGVNHAIVGHEIRANRITVDNEIVKNSTFKLLPGHDIEYDGNSLAQQDGSRYFMLNRPQGYVCSTDDPDHPTVLYFLDEPAAYKLHAAGRLDIDVTGLVLMTDDGQWSHRITSPRHHCEKTYLVTLESPVVGDIAEQFTRDVQLHNEKDLIKPAVLEVTTPTQVRLAISEGRYYQVKRMFAAAGNYIVELHRERTGDIRLDDGLEPGEYRPLTEEEIANVNLTPCQFQELNVITRQSSSITMVFILGLLAMLMPLSIDMYPPTLPVIPEQFGVPAGSTRMTLSTYTLGFAVGQLLYGPTTDSIRRKPVVLGGTLVFATAAVACALAQTIDQLIVIHFFHGLIATAANMVISALMCDIYPKEEFSCMMSFVMLMTTITPLLAPIVGGWVLVWLSWHYVFQILAMVAVLASMMIFTLIRETLPVKHRQPFRLHTTIGNFASLFHHERVLSYILASRFSFAGMFSFLSAGPSAYIEINHVSPQHFGYYFALNIIFLFVITIINNRFVRRVRTLNMFRIGLWIQLVMAGWMVLSALFGLGFWALAVGVAMFVGCVSIVPSNTMAVILDGSPHMMGTASSLAGTFHFGIGTIIGTLLSLAAFNPVWPMIWSVTLRATCSILFYLCASHAQKR